MLMYIFVYRMKRVSLHEHHSLSTFKSYHTYYKQFTEFARFAYTEIAKWIKIHWNIPHSICTNINLPGLTRIGHNWHLLPLNKNSNQGKEGKLQEKFHGAKRKWERTFFDYSVCKIKLSVVDLTCSAFCFLFCSPAGVLFEGSFCFLGFPSLFLAD